MQFRVRLPDRSIGTRPFAPPRERINSCAGSARPKRVSAMNDRKKTQDERVHHDFCSHASGGFQVAKLAGSAAEPACEFSSPLW
jgi:hypothetical protein